MRFSRIFITAAGLLLGCFLVGCGQPERSQIQSVSQSTTTGVSPVVTSTLPISKQFIDPQVFAATNVLKPFDFKGKPIAGVVNHHVLASDLVARFFKTLKAVRPEIETFVIISPDHFSRGQGVSTQGLTYVTSAGDAVVRKRWIFELKKTGIWDGTDSRVFEEEHGVGALAPFIAREFPGAKILPIFLRADLKPDQAKKFGEDLAKFSDEKTFVVISSDMSHYLKETDARGHDAETIKWLQRNQWDKLSAATDKNTDSGPAFMVLQAYLELKAPKKDFFLLSHKISTDYGADPNSTTSYIVGFWK
ncbi:MAG: AmmeMemoRadiSam system protein B [Patescibacteria group bacterium]|nr:AmmeMemoRadiSam system protein B [Patescibacteria group bacterium]